MGQKTDILQGTLGLMTLKTLATLGPLHGYGIARRIEFLTRGQAFEREVPDLALFTGDAARFGQLAPALARYGLERTEAF